MIRTTITAITIVAAALGVTACGGGSSGGGSPASSGSSHSASYQAGYRSGASGLGHTLIAQGSEHADNLSGACADSLSAEVPLPVDQNDYLRGCVDALRAHLPTVATP
jgi:hypothetical protein